MQYMGVLTYAIPYSFPPTSSRTEVVDHNDVVSGATVPLPSNSPDVQFVVGAGRTSKCFLIENDPMDTQNPNTTPNTLPQTAPWKWKMTRM